MEFRILGPLEAREDSRLVGLGAAKQRSLVGVLLLSANTVVSSERLIEELWPREPPATALKLVQGYVSGLRKVLGATRILTQPPGYLVRVEQGELDLHEFERLVARARGETPERAADLLREALAIWRGPALVDLRLEGSAAREAERLNEQRLAALLDRIEADLALGRSADLVGELEALVAEHPLRERPRGQLMLALYRAGRQADALALYRETRTLLVEELGLEPEEELQELHRRMLAHDAELDVPRPQATVETSDHAPAAAPEDGEAEQVRRLVTVVFADLVGSTTLGERLDPESLHGVLARYSEACADVLERHGGTVEKFLGDAVVAVFGLRSVHEDDALRAARAAVELRQVAREISGGVEAEWGVRIDIKVALNSGDVFVAAAGRRGAFAGGDVLTVAAGMVQSAQGGEILLGELTRRLLEHLVSAQPVAPLAVRGRAANVQVWRLLDLLAEEPLRPAVTAFVGRERELATLKQALERAATERDCRLYTVLGPPGIGKSRLARELIAAVGDRATVVVGRCPSYGPGVTYLPLAEIVRQLGRDRVSRLAEMTEAGERAKLIADLVLGTAGLSEGQSATEDTAWAFRRLFEALAQERPLVAVFEDLHWAEPALLDLLDSLAAFSNAAPILLLCLARPELLERQPAWATPRPTRALLVLEPLAETHAYALVDQLVAADIDRHARTRIVETAEGNPFFLEQLAAVQAESGAAALTPSIQALLTARIDRLGPGERTVLQRASVEGRSFHRGALVRLVPETEWGTMGSHLIALINKQLLRPDSPQFAGEDAFRFAHVLIREAAYKGLPIRLRADLHERIAHWLEEKPGTHEEIIGYHLEQASRFRRALSPLDPEAGTLSARAAQYLASASLRARARGDETAMVHLRKRAVSLLPVDSLERTRLLPEFGRALIRTGEYSDAEAILADAVESARAAEDRPLVLDALLAQQTLKRSMRREVAAEEAIALAEEAVSVFSKLDDHVGLARAWGHICIARLRHGNLDEGEHAIRKQIHHARQAQDARVPPDFGTLAQIAAEGPTPVEVGIERCKELLALAKGPRAEVAIHPSRAQLRAMLGSFEEARNEVIQARTFGEDFGYKLWAATMSIRLADVELLAGHPAAAEETLLRGCEALQQIGDLECLSLAAARLASAVYQQGRYDEALRITETSELAAAADHLEPQTLYRMTRGKVFARKGDFELAERLVREAVAMSEPTDLLTIRANALMDLAETLHLAGRPAEEASAVDQAIDLFEKKGNVVSAANARTRREHLGSSGLVVDN
jgi:DNA-binding SARP family transcriptional activator/tetratricopeptide (TPR) repeat protein